MRRLLLISALMSGVLYFTPLHAQTAYDGIPPDNIFTTGNMATPGVNDLLVYPNPATSNTRVVLDVIPVSSVFIDIIDLNGDVLRSYQYGPGTYQLDVDMSPLPTGMYSMRVSGRDIGKHNLKVVKE